MLTFVTTPQLIRNFGGERKVNRWKDHKGTLVHHGIIVTNACITWIPMSKSYYPVISWNKTTSNHINHRCYIRVFLLVGKLDKKIKGPTLPGKMCKMAIEQRASSTLWQVLFFHPAGCLTTLLNRQTKWRFWFSCWCPDNETVLGYIVPVALCTHRHTHTLMPLWERYENISSYNWR